MRSKFVIAIAATAAVAGSSALAEPVSVEVAYTTAEQMRFDFPDDSGHFVLAVRREGTAKGSGPFAGASVTEFGWHDVAPPVSGDPQAYLQITTADGDTAVLRSRVKAIFVKGEKGADILTRGYWEMVSGTGQFEGKRGVGSMVIKPAEQIFMLEGEVGDQP